MNSGDSAEQVVRVTMDSVEYILKIVGPAAASFAAHITSFMQGQKRKKGWTRLNTLIRSGKPLFAFSVPENHIDDFRQEAKGHGILYTVNKDKLEIITSQDNAVMVNRIFEKLGIPNVEMSTQENEKGTKKAEVHTVDLTQEINDLDSLMEQFSDKKNPIKEEPLNPSGPSSENSEIEITKVKKSVRKELNGIKKEVKDKGQKKTPVKTKTKERK